MSDGSDNEMDQSESNLDADEEMEKKVEKEVRQAYRTYREELIEYRLECIDPNSNLIENIMEKVDHTFKSVKKPREAVSDSNAILEIAILGKERLKNLHCAYRSFNNCEFIDKLKIYMAKFAKPDDNEQESSDDDEQTSSPKRNSKQYVLTRPIISNFGQNIMNYFCLLPRPKFLLGSLEKELILSKKQIVRQKKEKQPEDESKRTKIKELSADSNENEVNNTVGETERIFKILKRFYKHSNKEPICLYEFMINPKSFSRTIENIFYISFLVKDGFAKIYLDKDNLPVIEPMNEVAVHSQQNKQDKNKALNIQSMISLNKLQWKELIDVFAIQDTCIPESH